MSEDSIEDQKSIENELQHCSAESKAKIEAISSVSLSDESHSTGTKSNIENIYANGINFAELNETVHHTDSLDSFELIDYPDPDEIEIAGFNKKKLLKMCTFSKITYGNNDIKLSEAGYKTKAEFIREGYNIIPFYHTNGTLAGFVFTKDREITIAYRGTQGFDDIMTDINAWLTILEFLSEGGRVHYGFYNSFKDSRKCLADIIKTYADEQKLEIKDFKFCLTGHSIYDIYIYIYDSSWSNTIFYTLSLSSLTTSQLILLTSFSGGVFLHVRLQSQIETLSLLLAYNQVLIATLN